MILKVASIFKKDDIELVVNDIEALNELRLFI